MKCDNCGNEYSCITSHWSQSSCEYTSLNDYEIEIIEGLLLSDGSIVDVSNTNHKNSNFTVQMTTPRFLTWLSDQSEIFCEVLSKDRHKDKDNWNPTYAVNSLSLPDISNLRNKWYPNGEKVYPNNFNLTKLNVKLWYCGDGGLNWEGKRGAYADIKCSNESDNPDKLLRMFENLGFSPTFRQERICFNSETTDFLNWIGKPLPGFEYKWETVDRDSYDELMKLSYYTSKNIRDD